MPKFIQYIEHKGHEIMFLDCHGRTPEEVVEAMDEMVKAVVVRSRATRDLVLMDMSSTDAAQLITDKGKEITKATKGLPTLPTAIVGFTGMQKAIGQTFTIFRKPDTLYFADTLEEAKDWLVKVAEKKK